MQQYVFLLELLHFQGHALRFYILSGESRTYGLADISLRHKLYTPIED